MGNGVGRWIQAGMSTLLFHRKILICSPHARMTSAVMKEIRHAFTMAVLIAIVCVLVRLEVIGFLLHS